MLTRGILSIVLSLMGWVPLLAQTPVDPSQPAEYKNLAAFVGTWKYEVEVKPGFLGPGGRMSLTESCERLAGGVTVVCHAETLTRAGHLTTLSVLTYDSDEKVYKLYEFESTGRSNFARGTVDADTWTFVGESKRDGKLVRTRSTMNLSSSGSAVLKAEVSVNGGPWTLLLESQGARENQTLHDPYSCGHGSSEGWPFELFECYRSLSPH